MINIPKVTISVINYNDKKFIFKAIESAVEQSYLNLEIIITDNNSTDGTREEIGKRILEWEEKRKGVNFKIPPAPFLKGGVNCIKYIKNSENTGFGRPNNAALPIM